MADASEAAAYYAERVPQLGEAFLAQLARVVALAVERPELGFPMRAGRRRWHFSLFRFSLIYCVAPDDSLRVLAIAHHQRRPGYWRSRE